MEDKILKINFFWFRRDLRIIDNTALFHALKSGLPVMPVFIFDKLILDRLDEKNDARVNFIYQTVCELKSILNDSGSDLLVYYGEPESIWKQLISKFNVHTVFANHDYESYAQDRDHRVHIILRDSGISMQTFKDHVIFEKNEVVKDDGKPYTVFTPYKRKWLQKLHEKLDSTGNSQYLLSYPSEEYTDNFFKTDKIQDSINLESIGFVKSEIPIPEKETTQSIIRNYQEDRNFPARNGTSKLGVHFRFGTISTREKARKAAILSETFLSELIWRDFYAMILYQFPYVEHSSFRKEYDLIEWRNIESEFKAWCDGKTGYPIVDAGMRELLHTGYMHNRVRMITASFLTKHLLIDWRWGEAWFAKKLLDFDLPSNNGGWQWAAGSGTDAAPYFRIFSPDAQTVKFDKNFKYIKKWVPEYGTHTYPNPIVDHKMARERCLMTYQKALKSKTIP